MPQRSIPAEVHSFHASTPLQDGYLFQYSLDSINGGVCRLEKEYRLLDSSPLDAM